MYMSITLEPFNFTVNSRGKPAAIERLPRIHQLRTILLVLLLLSFGAGQNAMAAAPRPTGVSDLWGGGSESIALRGDGTVWTWGWDDFGMLGNGHAVTMSDLSTQYDSWVPFEVLGPNGVGHLNSIVAIAGGERHNAALDSNGDVWTWGWNYFGQLGTGASCTGGFNNLDCTATTPVKIAGFTSVKAIASRGYHTLALKNDGTVWAWGYNDSGRLGDGTNTDRHTPVQVNGLTGHGKVIAISGGGDVSAALMEDHSLMAWGNNSNGAAGIGITSTVGQWAPAPVSQTTGLTNVKAIATGWDHMIALAQDGTVWTWGSGADGQLGNGTRTNSSLPVQVSGLSNVTGVSAGDGSTVVVKADGTVWAWGTLRTEAGADKYASYYYGSTPVQVAGIDHVSLVRARDWHVLALKSDGTVWAWGWNIKGQCGDGTAGGDKITPVQVVFPEFMSKFVYLSSIFR
jgi:alpha-tubulin suppressor-like RCC1 family protein